MDAALLEHAWVLIVASLLWLVIVTALVYRHAWRSGIRVQARRTSAIQYVGMLDCSGSSPSRVCPTCLGTGWVADYPNRVLARCAHVDPEQEFTGN